MRILSLVCLFLIVISLGIWVYLGILNFVFSAKYNSTDLALGDTVLAFGLAGSVLLILFSLFKERKTKQNTSQNAPLPPRELS
jgi:pilus assembly protein TadC